MGVVRGGGYGSGLRRFVGGFAMTQMSYALVCGIVWNGSEV